MRKLTKTACEKARYPYAKGTAAFYVVWDRLLPGFGLRCNPAGTKTFVCAYRIRGKKRLLKIGRFPPLLPEEAREIAREALVEVCRGNDPRELRREEERQGTTLAELWERYLEDYARPHYKPNTLRNVEGAWRLYLEEPFGETPVNAFSRDEVARLQARIYSESGPYAANDAVKLLRRLLAQADQWGLVPQGFNPAKGLRFYKEGSRERYLSDDEHRRLHRALAAYEAEGGDPDVTAAVRLLLWTGCRAQEILKVSWEEIDFESRRIHRRDTKTGGRTILLPGPAVEELRKLQERNGQCAWVFPGRSKKKPRNDYIKRPWARILELAEIDDLRLHDLRHNAATVARRLGVSLKEVSDFLGHKRTATTEIYAHGDEGVQRELVERVAEAIQEHHYV